APDGGRRTAWDTYITWCPPYNSLYALLASYYSHALDDVPSGRLAGFPRHQSIDARLGDHLVVFYMRGIIDLGLLTTFFEKVTDEIANEVVSETGHGLDSLEDLPIEPRERMMDLWNARVANAQSSPYDHIKELRAFGAWYVAKALPREEALD